MLFPYFLVPSGLADLWGLAPINAIFHEPWLSITILMGAALLLLAVIGVATGVKRADPTALIAAVMLIMAVRVFSPQTDFALFKLVLYAVPFLVAAASTSYIRFTSVRIPRTLLGRCALLAPILIVAGAGLLSQFDYVERSRGEIGRGGSGLAEVPGASAAGMISELVHMNRSLPAHTRVISDTGSAIIAKIEAGIFRGHPLIFPSNPLIVSYSGRWSEALLEMFHRLRFDPFGPQIRAYSDLLRADETATSRTESFALPGGQAPDEFVSETGDNGTLKSSDAVLVTGAYYTVLNRRANPNGEQDVVTRSTVARSTITWFSCPLVSAAHPRIGFLPKCRCSNPSPIWRSRIRPCPD